MVLLASLTGGAAWAAGTKDVDAEAEARLDPNRREYGLLPMLAGNVDVGFGFGAIGSAAQFNPGFYPFHWRGEAMMYFTVKSSPEGAVELPYHNYYVEMDLPGLFDNRLRLWVALRFQRFANAGYFGIGNATRFEPPWEQLEPDTPGYRRALRHYQYDRVHPSITLTARMPLVRKLQLFFSGWLSYNWIGTYQDSKLSRDMQAAAAGDLLLAEALVGVSSHAQTRFDSGLLWDSRDHEVSPTRGVLADISLRGSPPTTYPYGGINAAARVYRTLGTDRLVFATRAMVDLLFGSVPFYELARHGGLFPDDGPGGGEGVRGIPEGRFHGRIKLIANFELRARLARVTVLKQRLMFGAVAFFDTGRVFADYVARSDVDGKGLGLKYGTGAGLRVRWGETFMVRVDLAWSPDADPIGVYFEAGHVF